MELDKLTYRYSERYEKYLSPATNCLESHIRGCLDEYPRIDRISARAKSTDRFIRKAEKKQEDGSLKYADPLNQIQDQLGARVVVYYLSDVEATANLIRKYIHPIEDMPIIPDAYNEFGYTGWHQILRLPTDVSTKLGSDAHLPDFFELQIKTLFQHAWAESEHDLGYKPSIPLTSLHKRKIAFTAAQAWGADQIFEELFQEVQAGTENGP